MIQVLNLRGLKPFQSSRVINNLYSWPNESFVTRERGLDNAFMRLIVPGWKRCTSYTTLTDLKERHLTEDKLCTNCINCNVTRILRTKCKATIVSCYFLHNSIWYGWQMSHEPQNLIFDWFINSMFPCSLTWKFFLFSAQILQLWVHLQVLRPIPCPPAVRFFAVPLRRARVLVIVMVRSSWRSWRDKCISACRWWIGSNEIIAEPVPQRPILLSS